MLNEGDGGAEDVYELSEDAIKHALRQKCLSPTTDLVAEVRRRMASGASLAVAVADLAAEALRANKPLNERAKKTLQAMAA